MRKRTQLLNLFLMRQDLFFENPVMACQSSENLSSRMHHPATHPNKLLKVISLLTGVMLFNAVFTDVSSVNTRTVNTLKISDKIAYANSADPDQTAPSGAV